MSMLFKRALLFSLLISFYNFKTGCTTRTVELPPSLLVGSASSAYQVEGAWNEDGKGENIWDRMAHTHPEQVIGGTNGDIACDSYHKLYEDIKIIKNLGLQFYRFSLSWTRILPNGFLNNINKPGITYYNNLINRLLENNVIPMITIYHWDLPQTLQELGGLVNPNFEYWYEAYANIVFKLFGDRVKFWITFNEPKQICNINYAIGEYVPGLTSDGISTYICGHNVLKAHARVYHLYNEIFRPIQNGKIGFNSEYSWFESATNSIEDQVATERAKEFDFGMYLNPIYSRFGDYPKVVKNAVAERSRLEGFERSRLPQFSSSEVKYIKGTSDFFGLNYYSNQKIKNKEPEPIGEPSKEKDKNVEILMDFKSDKPWQLYFNAAPLAFKKTLNEIKTRYRDPDIYILETGIPDEGEIDDQFRIKYFRDNLDAVVSVIRNDKIKVRGFTAWSLMDNFEWRAGYTFGFGLYYVNFTDPSRKRIPKSSAIFFKNLLSNRTLVFN